MIVHDLFPSTVTIIDLEDVSKYEDELFSNELLPKSQDFIAKNASVSSNKTILDSNPEVKEIVQDAFNKVKDEVLKLNNTSFEITTSWLVEINENGHGKPHQHRNSAYSAIVYFDDVEEGGEITFSSVGVKPTSFLLMPTEYNTRTSELFSIKPSKNKMIVFPSYLHHTVGLYVGSKTRRSLAVNFFPSGLNGTGDSTMWTKQDKNI